VNDPRTQTDAAIATAARVYADYRRRAERGDVQRPADLLAAHPDLRPALSALLRADLGPVPGAVDVLGGYRLLAEIGRGGNGVVYRAAGTRPAREVACKLIHGHLLGDARGRERFWCEATAAARLQHAGICPVYDFGEHRGLPYIVMRLLRGGSLESRLAAVRAGSGDRPRLAWRGATELGAAVAAAVHHAHERGVVHGDIKPGNVMFDEDGHPVVVDFGLAVEAGIEAVEQGGTLAYMAPERVLGAPPSPGADVFALGVMLHETLTGRRPFGGRYAPEVRSAILHAAPEPMKAVPRDLRTLVAACLDKDPRRRVGSAGELAEELRRVLRREPICTRAPGPSTRAWRWAARNPIPTAILAVAAATSVWMAHLLRQLERAERANSVPALRHRAEAVVTDARALFPASPDRLEPMAAWLRGAEDLLAKARSLSPEDDVERLAVETATRAVGAAIEMVRGQQAWARDRAAAAPGEAAAWQVASAAIAAADGICASPLYDRAPILLRPQADLVPLGMNPATGLWEFYHLRSAQDPTRAPPFDGSGGVEVKAGTGIVFVLVPGSTSPPVPPFFIARHEVTFAQWERLVASVHAAEPLRRHRPGTILCGTVLQPTHPVNDVDWDTATEVLARHGLALPSNVEWEYACRAGSRSTWSTGDDPASLAGYANIVDVSGVRLKPEWGGAVFDDGFEGPSPVGTFRANRWGLYDMHGNLAEWCRDAVVPVGGVPMRRVSTRGGSYDENAFAARCAAASVTSPSLRDAPLGLRVVRPLLPAR